MTAKFSTLQKIELAIDELVDELWFWDGMICQSQRERAWKEAKIDSLEQRIEDLRLLAENL